MTASNIRTALESRRGEINRDADVAGGVYTVDGVIPMTGTGEVTVDVLFPVTFIEKPVLLGGGGVADNQAILAGEFPEWNVGVQRWNRVISEDFPDMPTYKGATLLVLIKGATAQASTFQSEVYWTARGRALTNPIVVGELL